MRKRALQYSRKQHEQVLQLGECDDCGSVAAYGGAIDVEGNMANTAFEWRAACWRAPVRSYQ